MATVLLVEDDNNLREIYEARLQAEGYQILSAHDGEEALVVAKENKPDLIIADIMMPKISGLEMLDIIRNTTELQGVKIIMLTALGQAEDQQKASNLGADKYLVKSQVTLEDIVNTAHELLAQDGSAPTAPPAPAAAPALPAPQPATPATPAPTPVSPAPLPTPPASDTGTAADDKLIDEAAKSLVTNPSANNPAPATTDATPTPPAAEPMPAPTEPAPAEQPATPAAPSLEVDKGLQELLTKDNEDMAGSGGMGNIAGDQNAGAEPSSIDHVPIKPPEETSSDYLSNTDGPIITSTPGSSMKIIEPIPQSGKPDIQQLVAQEDSTEAAGSGGLTTSQPETPVVDAPTPPPQPGMDDTAQPVAQPGTQVNPSDIAL